MVLCDVWLFWFACRPVKALRTAEREAGSVPSRKKFPELVFLSVV
jgi:hypothetical protein